MANYRESLADNPCTGRCSNLAISSDSYCSGCGRTRAEIDTWNSIPNVERKLINMFNWDRFDLKQKSTRKLNGSG